MSEYPNPALRSILLRTIVPFVPVWLFGTVLALLLAQLGLVRSALAVGRVEDFLLVYSTLVVALVGLLAFYQYRSTPGRIAIGVDGLLAWHGSETGASVVALPFEQLRTVVGRGLFGYRVEGRPASAPRGPIAWLNLTPENAERVAAAWLAWKAREAEPEPPFLGIAASPAWRD
ncbi:MAG: hypothetical protein L3K06_02810 [Thermoplasmata archaeon]|nr:hypothetical protein [Thermoplasmata archaeon]MCI4354278.1 hypothetical protein [Thermoplasmata archaeon]